MTNPNPLQSIPARLRSILYVAYGLIALGYLIASAFYDHDPDWVEGVGRVVQALAVPFGAVAASNVPPAKAPVQTVVDHTRDK